MLGLFCAVSSTVVRRRRKLGAGFLYGVYRPGEWFELTPTVKMETRLPIEGSFGNQFPSIYNQCGVVAAWSRKRLKKNKFLRYCRKKTSDVGNFLNFVPKGFIATLVVVLCSNVVKFGQRDIGQIVRCLSDKKKNRLALRLSLLRRSRPRSVRLVPENVLRVLQISSESVQFQWSHSRLRKHHENGP